MYLVFFSNEDCVVYRCEDISFLEVFDHEGYHVRLGGQREIHFEKLVEDHLNILLKHILQLVFRSCLPEIVEIEVFHGRIFSSQGVAQAGRFVHFTLVSHAFLGRLFCQTRTRWLRVLCAVQNVSNFRSGRNNVLQDKY